MSKWGRCIIPLLLALLSASAANAAITCTLGSDMIQVRSEGLAERLGDVRFACTGGTPGETISGALYLFPSAPVTNRIMPSGSLDASLSINIGDPATAVTIYATPTTGGLVFQGINFAVPASGQATLTVTNIRGAVASAGLNSTNPITASVVFNGGQLNLTNFTVIIGLPVRGLAASVNSILVRCNNAPAPATVSMSGLFAAGTPSISARVTGAFNNALEKRRAPADSGVRFLLRYSGFPTGAHLYVPNVIAGSDATQPTAGGDLASFPSAGIYTPVGDGSLLLARVEGADMNGAGGAPVYTPGPPGSGPIAPNGAAEIPLVNGAAQVVFEVVDNNPNTIESAELPSFIAFRLTGGETPPPATISVVMGPVSASTQATATDPIPRFLDVPPPTDCAIFDDCANLPIMRIQAPPLEFTSVINGPARDQWVFIINDGGGSLVWSATLAYKNGAGWVNLHYNYTLGVRLTISSQGLAPGVYEATLTIDGGSYAGSRALPIKLTVNGPAVQIDAIAHSATFVQGPAVPGSLFTLWGKKLNGASTGVTFDGLPATLLYKSDNQINLQVPSELGTRATAQVVATVDGVQSLPFTAQLTAMSPGIFSHGVTNLDGSLNSQANPAAAGSWLIAYATGVPSAAAGTVTVRLADRDLGVPAYAGPAPTLTGVQQVNIHLPADFASMNADLIVCGQPPTGAAVCSPPVTVAIRP